MNFQDKFDEVYGPLVRSFVEVISRYDISDYRGIPHIFLPIWGEKYGNDSSKKKIAFVGQHTSCWKPELDVFLKKYKADNGYNFQDDRNEFQKCFFVDWGTGRNSPNSFWRFVMEIIAKSNGIADYKALKKDEYISLINDFVWGNCLSLQPKGTKGLDNNGKGYAVANNASIRFNSINHLEEVFSPDIIILLGGTYYKKYLGDGWKPVERVNECIIKVLERNGVIVLQSNLPKNLNMRYGGCSKYSDAIAKLLNEYGYVGMRMLK